MVFNLLPWLLHGISRPQYEYKKAKNGVSSLITQDFNTFILCLIGFISTRLLFNFVLAKPTSLLAKRRGKDDTHKDGRKLLEECWVLSANVFMLFVGLFVALRHNGGCTFRNISPCLVGWPNHDADAVVVLYYSMEMAYYVHLLLKPVFKYGLDDGRDIMTHHCASLTLLLAACGLNLFRMGIVVLTLFSISNPALHAAKIVNQLDVKGIRVAAFAFFALVFFLTRVVLVPIVVLMPAVVGSRRWVPYAVHDFPLAYIFLNTMLLVLYALQLVWMWAIVRVLRQAVTEGPDAASHLSSQVDPAKRFAQARKKPE